MNIQEIQSELDRLKAEETSLYDRIDEVQARLIDLLKAKEEKEFWIRKNAERPVYEPAPVNTDAITPEQTEAIMTFNSDKRFTINE